MKAKYYVHPKGLCESDNIGDRSRVWAFAHVLPGAKIGEDVNICDHVFIEDDVIVGDRVTLKSGVQLWNGIKIENDVFIGPNVSFTNDPNPRSKKYLKEYLETTIEKGASIGAGAVILPGVRVGRYAMVGAGSVVTRDVPAFAKVTGNPARIKGYVNEDANQVNKDVSSQQKGEAALPFHSRFLFQLNSISDLRGNLTVAEFQNLPFEPRRFFFISEVSSSQIRGSHAHRKCEQLLICMSGSVRVALDDGISRSEFILDNPQVALHIPTMFWGTQFGYSSDAVLGVFASHPYDESDYIRDYASFIRELGVS